MRCVRFKHLNLLLYLRLTAVIACWLSTRHTSGIRTPKYSCTKSCTGSPKCLNPWLRATTSLSAVLHEVADCPEDLLARKNTLPDFGLTSSKCIPLTLRDVQASPFQSASVESSGCRPFTSSGESVPTNSRDASVFRYHGEQNDYLNNSKIILNLQSHVQEITG